jgi:hypothetical protein
VVRGSVAGRAPDISKATAPSARARLTMFKFDATSALGTWETRRETRTLSGRSEVDDGHQCARVHRRSKLQLDVMSALGTWETRRETRNDLSSIVSR